MYVESFSSAYLKLATSEAVNNTIVITAKPPSVAVYHASPHAVVSSAAVRSTASKAKNNKVSSGGRNLKAR
jgi:hypothetical protein